MLRPWQSVHLLLLVCLTSVVGSLGAGESPAGEESTVAERRTVTVESLQELQACAKDSDLLIKMSPGVYRLDQGAGPDFLTFSGSKNRFELGGVVIEFDTGLAAAFPGESNVLNISGNEVEVVGLEIVSVGNQAPGGGCRVVSVTGDNVTVRGVRVHVEGSAPYGYGSFFGINSRGAIPPRKFNGIRLGGLNGTLIDCHVVMRSMGHGIFVRGAQNTLIQDCSVEGALRPTDEILAETSGPAFDRDFRQYTGEPIPAGEMTSLSEDGIRAYPEDPWIDRVTRDVRVVNCQVLRMRRGICLAFASGDNVIERCEVRESERVGYHVRSNTVITECRGDALYSQVLDISTESSRRSTVDLRVLDSRRHYGNSLLAKINGTDHEVRLSPVFPNAVPSGMSIEVASDRGFGEGRMAAVGARGLRLQNNTLAEVRLNPEAADVTVESLGPVIDHGRNNAVSRLPAATRVAP